MMRSDFSRADQTVRQGLRDGAYTAACLLVGQGDQVLFRRAYGRLDFGEDSLHTNEHTLFDVDSLTKPLVTGMLAMRALEAGKLCLSDKLGSFIDAPADKADITIAQLLTHTAGFSTGLHLWRTARTPEEAAGVILSMPLASAPGTQVQYCCAGYILLAQLLECLYDMNLPELAMQEVFWPLRMQHTGFHPANGNTAATEMQDDGRCLRGIVHDENAQFLGGAAGNAGLFTTMDDLALFWQMIAAEGSLPDGSRYLSRATVKLMLENRTPDLQPPKSLLFALPALSGGFTGDLFPKETVGHTGFTGCSMAYDPTTKSYAVFLTNRICPSRDNPSIHRLRRLVHNAVYASL